MHRSYSAARGSLLSIVGMSLLLSAAGCGSRGTVSGKVLYKGKPLPGGGVIFIHDRGAFSSPIQEDGSYRIDKVPVGPVKITLTGPAGANNRVMGAMPRGVQAEKAKKNMVPVASEEKGPKALMAEMIGPKASQGKKPGVIIPRKYGNPEESGLTYTVGSGSQTYNIELE